MSTKDLVDISFRKRHKFAALQPNKFKGSEFIAEYILPPSLPVLGTITLPLSTLPAR